MSYSSPTTSCHTAPRGYCLVITVILLAIAATALMIASRQTIRTAMQADQGARNLQRTWGTRSIGRELTGQSGKLLAAAEEVDRKPLATYTLKLTLGELPFEIRIADEDAMLNLRTLLSRSDSDRVAKRLRDILRPSPLVNRIVLQNSAMPTRQRESVLTFGDVFAAPTLDELTSRNQQLAVTDQLTCYGSGRINLMRASKDALRAALEDQLGGTAVSRLLLLRTQENLMSLPQLIDSLLLTETQRRQAGEMLSMSSQSYSILILADHRGRLVLENAGPVKGMEW